MHKYRRAAIMGAAAIMSVTFASPAMSTESPRATTSSTPDSTPVAPDPEMEKWLATQPKDDADRIRKESAPATQEDVSDKTVVPFPTTGMKSPEPEDLNKAITVKADAPSDEIEAYLATLPKAEADELRKSSLPATTTMEATAAPEPILDLGAASATKRCYMGYANFANKNAFNVVILKWNITHAWCIRNNRVVEAGPTDGGITLATSGWKDMNQENFSGAVTNYGWRGRSLGKYKAEWKIAGTHISTVTKCVRVISDTNAKITFRGTGCTL